MSYRNLLNKYYFPQEYLPSQDFSTHDTIEVDGKPVKVDYTFKKAMRVLSLQQEGDIGGIMEELGLSYKDSLTFLSAFANPRWEDRVNKALGLTPEEEAKINKAERVFDVLLDFDAYFVDFITYYNIDLLEQDIPYLKFEWLLSGLFAKEDSVIAKRIKYRSYKKGKHEDSEYAKAMMDMRKRYDIREKPITDEQTMFDIIKERR